MKATNLISKLYDNILSCLNIFMRYSLILVTLALLFTSSTVKAQVKALEVSLQPSITFGGKFFAPDLGDTDYDSTSRQLTIGNTFSVNVIYEVRPGLSINVGIGYKNTGQKYYYESENIALIPGNNFKDVFESQVKLHYILVPVNLELSKQVNEKFNFIFSPGLYWGILTNFNDTREFKRLTNNGLSVVGTTVATNDTYQLIEGGNNNSNVITGLFLDKPFRNFDFGFTVNSGLVYSINNRLSFPVMLGVNFGLLNVKNPSSQVTTTNSNNAVLYWNENNPSSPNINEKFRNTQIGLRIGLRYTL